MNQDPVCRMKVSPENAAGKSTFRENTYHFCSPGCKRKFDQNPEQYAIIPSSDTAQTPENPQPDSVNHFEKTRRKKKLDMENEGM